MVVTLVWFPVKVHWRWRAAGREYDWIENTDECDSLWNWLYERDDERQPEGEG